MKKRLLVFIIVASVVCMNFALADLVNNGDFSSPSIAVNTTDSTANCLDDTWAKPSTSWGLYNPASVTAPLAGQVMYCNGDPSQLRQTFAGVSLLPNKTYTLTFDAYTSIDGPHTINAGFYHGVGSGSNSAIVATLNYSDLANDPVVSNGTWMGTTWAGGATFTTTLNPSANDASIYHEIKIRTASSISGSGDLGVILWGETGIQMLIDNVKVEVIPEPAALGFLGLLGLAFFRRK